MTFRAYARNENGALKGRNQTKSLKKSNKIFYEKKSRKNILKDFKIDFERF
jgi:hypothetical protein